MMDSVITFSAVWLGILTLIAVLTLARLVKLHIGWLITAFVIFALNAVSLFYLKHFVPVEAVFGELHWNWGGKIAAIIVSLLVVAALWFIARKPPSEVGFTLAQKPGSFMPSVVATALLVAIVIGVQLWFNDGPQNDPERLLYQATMPGLDEELYWRGTLLLALTEALRSGRWNLFGAGIGWGGGVMTVMFGVLHGVVYQGGEWMVMWSNIAITGVLGFGLLWIRERTGSILLPIIAHNLMNFVLSLV